MARDTGNLRAEIVSSGGCGWTLIEMGEIEEAQRAFERVAAVTQRIGARRFEPYADMYLAKIAAAQNRPGDAQRLAKRAVETIRETGTTAMTFLGPRALGVYCLIVRDADSVAAALAEGEAILRKGCIAHNHLWFYRYAMEWALESGHWSEAERYAGALEEFTRDEPLPWGDFFVARARALAAYGMGRRDAGTTKVLRELRDRAARAGLASAVPPLERALSGD